MVATLPATRPALVISAGNALSRATGFVRVVAVGAALGTTYLGNTYQSANLVSNVLFEVLAAGMLSAPLVPAFVGLLDTGREREAERLAGALLGPALLGLGVLVVVLAVGGRAVMQLLTMGVDDPAVREAEVRLGAFLLWFFLPQMLFYAVGAVTTAMLNARRRFAAAALAPIANNVVVTATMVAFMLVGPGEPTMGLSTGDKLLLGLGTTGGVLAMTLVPVLALRRLGMRLRPRLARGVPALREVARAGAWAGVLLAATQLLIGVTLVLANRVAGGVVAFQIAFTFFLLPFALLAHPVITAVFPTLAEHVHAGDRAAFRRETGSALSRVLVLVVPASAMTAALAAPVLGLVRLGEMDRAGVRFVGRVLAAYAVGLGGYAAFQLLARAATAAGEGKLAALVGLGVTAVGAVLMTVLSSAAEGRDRVVVLGLAHSVAVTLGAVVLHRLLFHRSGGENPASDAGFSPPERPAGQGATA
jgi:putative peptidoglycan lipid II flippase